ncbi:hypothetical protein [Candidatus Electronema sp. TJ]|uniref:hypothetical protein n=1 Tax=Candidatus Electronema sp. TJ TaxID=3401573 RepID=UPI003AA87889
MTKLKLTAAFALFSAAALSGCTVCVDCEPQSARNAPLGRQENTYYYSDSWTEPRRQTSWPAPRTAVSTSYYSSAPVISTPVTSYRPLLPPTWRPTSRPAFYSPQRSRYAAYAYQQPAARLNQQYSSWPSFTPPQLPSAEWQARFIGQNPQVMYYYPPASPFANAMGSSMARRYWASPPPAAFSDGYLPADPGPVWQYP